VGFLLLLHINDTGLFLSFHALYFHQYYLSEINTFGCMSFSFINCYTYWDSIVWLFNVVCIYLLSRWWVFRLSTVFLIQCCSEHHPLLSPGTRVFRLMAGVAGRDTAGSQGMLVFNLCSCYWIAVRGGGTKCSLCTRWMRTPIILNNVWRR